jgi:serine/threonine-protein kinase/endoribonuclease IRE1
LPWEWIANVPESLAQSQKSWTPSPSALLLALVSIVASLLWFKRKVPTSARDAIVPNELAGKAAFARNAVSITPLGPVNGATYASNLVQAVENEPSAEASLPKDPVPPMKLPPAPPALAPEAPLQSSTRDDSAKASTVKADSPEGAEDVGEVKKKHRKRRRRRKGDAKDASAEGEEPENEDGEGGEEGNVLFPNTPSLVPPPDSVRPATSSLVVSDTVLGMSLNSYQKPILTELGYGSHGTVVYVGSLQGRAVAVKRLLRDFVTLAHREVCLLKDADDHPNVIRYYYQEAHASFLYIALELCPASLADIIERPDLFRETAVSFNPKRAVRQITSGLRHLHALKIVHRDIKPQNILISGAKKGESSGHRMLISDFGLCRKLELDQTSFLPTAGGAMGVGTFGWRAPEILRGEVKLDEAITDDNSQGSRDSVGTATGSNHSGTGKPTTRLTKSVDIFALGCLYYYCLTNGGHPFGDRFEREVNIMRDQKSLHGLEGFGEEGSEAVDLINSMLAPEAADRCVDYS